MKHGGGNIVLMILAAIVCFPVGVIMALAKKYN